MRRNREEVGESRTRGGGEGWPDCTNKSGNVIFVRRKSLERRDVNIGGRRFVASRAEPRPPAIPSLENF